MATEWKAEDGDRVLATFAGGTVWGTICGKNADGAYRVRWDDYDDECVIDDANILRLHRGAG
jgi:hypothetical protein